MRQKNNTDILGKNVFVKNRSIETLLGTLSKLLSGLKTGFKHGTEGRQPRPAHHSTFKRTNRIALHYDLKKRMVDFQPIRSVEGGVWKIVANQERAVKR